MHSGGDEPVYLSFPPRVCSVERNNKWVSFQNGRSVSPFFWGRFSSPAITPWPLSIIPALLASLQTEEGLAGLPCATSLVHQSTNTVKRSWLWDHGKMRHGRGETVLHFLLKGSSSKPPLPPDPCCLQLFFATDCFSYSGFPAFPPVPAIGHFCGLL